jgi:hypothetical protein
LQCDVCLKHFQHSSSLSRHKKSHLNSSALGIGDVSIVGNNNKVQQSLQHTTVNNIKNININILPFGSETIEHVENNPQLLEECIKNVRHTGIPELISQIFFNDDQPQNKNVKLGKQYHPPKMLVFTDGAWTSCDRSTILDKMITKGTNILIKYNTKIFSLDAIDDDIFDYRSQTLSDINSKKKGLYAPIKSRIVDNAK